MKEDETQLIEVIRAGLERACKEFTVSIAPLGFARTKKMLWTREKLNTVECISFFRRGSTYGSPRNASVEIRVSFFTHAKGSNNPSDRLEGPWSDKLRDVRGYAYHLRFNASSWSTYDRCLDDLVRVTKDHGLPWFESRAASNGLK